MSYRFGIITVACVVFIAAYVKLAMRECDSFDIPDQLGKIVIVTGGNSGASLRDYY